MAQRLLVPIVSRFEPPPTSAGGSKLTKRLATHVTSTQITLRLLWTEHGGRWGMIFSERRTRVTLIESVLLPKEVATFRNLNSLYDNISLCYKKMFDLTPITLLLVGVWSSLNKTEQDFCKTLYNMFSSFLLSLYRIRWKVCLSSLDFTANVNISFVEYVFNSYMFYRNRLVTLMRYFIMFSWTAYIIFIAQLQYHPRVVKVCQYGIILQIRNTSSISARNDSLTKSLWKISLNTDIFSKYLLYRNAQFTN